MGAPKRMPSFSQRPGFPCGLRVLLVDSDADARSRTEEQLRQCSYEVTACTSCAEAVVHLSSSPSSFDVLLADKGAIGCAAAAVAGGVRSGLLESCRGVPCILMAADPSPDDVMHGISLGAVDFLAKPLCQLKLRNIWQHTVRQMMGGMRIQCSGKPKAAPAAAAAPSLAPRAPAQAPAPAPLDRSASNALDDAPPFAAASEQRQQQQQQQQQDAPAPSAAGAAPAPRPPGLPPRSPAPRSPILRARRAAPRAALNACVSSTDLAAPRRGAATEDDDGDFDFDAAEAAFAPPAAARAPMTLDAPAASPEPSCGAPAATAATTTATATHATLPPSAPAPAYTCGMPVPGALAPLAAGMVWGMPMPVVRAPGIVPPQAAAAAAGPLPQQQAPWGGFVGCPMPLPGFMAPPHPFMMMPPPGMCGPMPAFPGACFAPPMPYPGACYPPPQQQQHYPHEQQQQQPAAPAAPTGAAAAQALDASLMSLLGSAEDDDLEMDLDDVLQDLGDPDHAATAAAEKLPRPCPSAGEGACASGSSGYEESGAEDDLLGRRGASSPGSMASSQGAPPRGGGRGGDAGGEGEGGDADDFEGLLGSCGGGKGLHGAGKGLCGGLVGFEDDEWGDGCAALGKSSSLADLLAVA